MTRQIALRLGWGALTLLGTSVIVFLLVHVVPADPVRTYAGPQADKETLDRLRHELRLDDPLWMQYGRFVGRALRGDLGQSLITRQPVIEALRTRFPATLAVSLGGLAIWVLAGIPIGVVTARYRDTPFDRTVLVLSMVSISLPTFWLGRILQFELAYRGGHFPVAGLVSWRHLILPSVTLGIVGVGYYARLVHSNMIEVLTQDYIRAARARGLPEALVLFKHALPNALIPVITVLGRDAAALLGGVVFTETVFALPGVGSLAVQAVLSMDVPMIVGTTLFAAAMVVAANVIVDVLYPLIDPRIKTGRQ